MLQTFNGPLVMSAIINKLSMNKSTNRRNSYYANDATPTFMRYFWNWDNR